MGQGRVLGCQGPLPAETTRFGRKVGVLGLGKIEFEVDKRLQGFDMDIAYTDIARKNYAPDWTFFSDPLALVHHADFLFVTLAASTQTRHIVNRDRNRPEFCALAWQV